MLLASEKFAGTRPLGSSHIGPRNLRSATLPEVKYTKKPNRIKPRTVECDTYTPFQSACKSLDERFTQ